MVDLPMKNGDFPISLLLVYQRVPPSVSFRLVTLTTFIDA